MSVTISQAIETFLLDCKTRALRPASLTTYRRQLGFFATFANGLGLTHLDQVDTHALRLYIAHLQDKGLRPASIRTAGKILRAWFLWCKAEGLVTDDAIIRRVRLPKRERPNPNCFTPAEVRRLLEATSHDSNPERARAIVLCLLDTGCRIGEFAQLRACDVDMDTGAVTIRSETSKTGTQRVVFLGERARAALVDYLATYRAGPQAQIWRNCRRATPIGVDGLKHAVQRIGQRAKVHPAGPHKYRRTFATFALHDGMDPKTTAAILGHSVEELLRSYVHSDDDTLRIAHALHGPVDKLLK